MTALEIPGGLTAGGVGWRWRELGFPNLRIAGDMKLQAMTTQVPQGLEPLEPGGEAVSVGDSGNTVAK